MDPPGSRPAVKALHSACIELSHLACGFHRLGLLILSLWPAILVSSEPLSGPFFGLLFVRELDDECFTLVAEGRLAKSVTGFGAFVGALPGDAYPQMRRVRTLECCVCIYKCDHLGIDMVKQNSHCIRKCSTVRMHLSTSCVEKLYSIL